MSAGAALRRPIVCLITDRSLVGDRSLADVVAEAGAGGVTMVQLREKDLQTRALLELATQLRQMVQPPAVLSVNGRADVAYAAAADGVHLPADGLPIVGARAALGDGRLVGRSVHSAAEAAQAALLIHQGEHRRGRREQVLQPLSPQEPDSHGKKILRRAVRIENSVLGVDREDGVRKSVQELLGIGAPRMLALVPVRSQRHFRLRGRALHAAALCEG